MKVLTIILIVICMLNFGIASADLYPETAQVVQIDYTNDIVIVETFTGFLFSFYGCDDWAEGDCCALLMEDNGTADITDDIIVMAYFSGWILSKD